MNSYKQYQKPKGRLSRFHTRLAGLFTLKKFVLLLLVASIIVGRSWQSYKLIKTTQVQLRQITGLEWSIMYHDELLTMSVRMAAATGDMKWATRYEQAGQRIRPTIEETWDISEGSSIGEDAILTAFADDKLKTMEDKALELIRKGKPGDAAIILQSQEYDNQKHAYNTGMNTFVANVRRILENRNNEYWQKIQVESTTLGIILLTILFIGFVVHGLGKYIYERKVAKRKLNAFTREWQKTFNAITDGVSIIDKNGKIIQCNKAMTQFLKRPDDEIIGGSCCELFHGSSEHVKNCPLVHMFKTGRSEATDFQIGERWFNIKVDPLIGTKGHLVGAVHILSDITEHRKATMALRESENKFRLAFANAQDAIVWIESETGIITNCNKSAEELFGRGRKKIIGQHHTTFYPDDKRENYHSLLVESSKKPNSNIEAEIIGGGGKIRTVTIAVSTMFVEEKEILQGIMRDITESKNAIEEIRSLAKFPSEDPNPVLRVSKDCKIIYANDASSSALNTWKTKEGESLPRPWSNRIEEVYHSGNSATYELNCDDGHMYFITLQPILGSGYVNAYGLDITKRKKAEKEKMELELQLSQKQKIEAIGTLAGGIAHDFNNILAAMQGYVELSLDELSEDSQVVRDYLEQIKSCTNRATQLVKQILTFSRKDQEEEKKEPVQISLIVKEVLGMLRSSLPSTIKICRKIHAKSSMVMADPTQIHQVLVNLCTNASHAMREKGGHLEVSLIDVNLESETRIGDELLKQGPHVKLSVSDSGCGMEKEVAERIFEPFFTTKKVNEGTGLGLSVVHGIIKSYGGAITVSSTPGEGTTFDIFLPKIEGSQAKDSEPSKPNVKDKEVILLVDDEEMVVDVTKQTLEKLGFGVVGKTSSLEALEVFQEEPDGFDLVITDQVMPNMTGTELAEKLISIKPDIPVILCSGFPENIYPEELERIGIKEFINKPITREQIASIVRAVLDKSNLTV